MKNFYEATVIKPALRLPIELTLTPITRCVCVVLLNGAVVHDGLLTGPKVILDRTTAVDSPINIKVIVTRQHPEAVEIGVQINGHSIIPLYQHLASPQTAYLNFNGEWNLHIPNFYTWHHNITGQGWII